METKEMDLDDIKSNLLALRQLYGLLQNNKDLDYEAQVMLKNFLVATTKDVFKAHSEILERQARMLSSPPQLLDDTMKQRPLALLDQSKSSAVIQNCGKEPVVLDSTLLKEKQESIMPITQTASTQSPQFSFSTSESGNQRKFCIICQRPKSEKLLMPCRKTELTAKGAPGSTKFLAFQQQQNTKFSHISWDIPQEALQSVSNESVKAKEVLDVHCISSGAETVAPLSDTPASDLIQSMHETSGVTRRVADQNHDQFSTESHDDIKQLELQISALQMDAENLLALADKHEAEHKIIQFTDFVPQADLAIPIKIDEALMNDNLSQSVAVLDDSPEQVITHYSQEPKDPSSSLYQGYAVPPFGMLKFSADQLLKPLESSNFQSNQLRQQKIVANVIPTEIRDASNMIDLVEEHQWQIQKENPIKGQSIQSIVDKFESLSQSKNQINRPSRQNAYVNSSCSQQDQHNMETGVTTLPAVLVIENQNQMASNEKTVRLGKLIAARQVPAADILRNNIDTAGLIDYRNKLTWSGTYERTVDSPYSEQEIIRRSELNHKLGQFTPSQSFSVNLNQKPSKYLKKPSKYPKNSNHVKQARRRHLHVQESEVSHSSSPYSSSRTDLQQTSSCSSERDDSLPRKIRTKIYYSDEASSYGGSEYYPRKDTSQTDYTVSSSCSPNESYSSPISSERAHEMIPTSRSEGEIPSSRDHSRSDHLEEPSYYSADSSSRRSSPARVSKSADRKIAKKNKGSWKKLKDKLAVVFHHHHHHHHHHHGKDAKAEDRKTSLLRQRGKRFHGPYSSSKDEAYEEKALEKFGKSALDNQASKKKQGAQFHTLAKGLVQHIQHSKKSKHSSSRVVDKGHHSNKKVTDKFHWWQLLRRHHRGLNKPPAMLGTGNKRGH